MRLRASARSSPEASGWHPHRHSPIRPTARLRCWLTHGTPHVLWDTIHHQSLFAPRGMFRDVNADHTYRHYLPSAQDPRRSPVRWGTFQFLGSLYIKEDDASLLSSKQHCHICTSMLLRDAVPKRHIGTLTDAHGFGPQGACPWRSRQGRPFGSELRNQHLSFLRAVAREACCVRDLFRSHGGPSIRLPPEPPDEAPPTASVALATSTSQGPLAVPSAQGGARGLGPGLLVAIHGT